MPTPRHATSGRDSWHAVRQDRCGGNPGTLRQVIRINNVPTTVIGDMRRGFRFPIENEIWKPLIPGASREARGPQLSAAGLFPEANWRLAWPSDFRRGGADTRSEIPVGPGVAKRSGD